jgi:hypothetical protein
VRCFGTCTADLEMLADWLRQCGVTTVAMEATGVYWIALFELLERRGFEVYLVDPRQSKRAPGRPKTDVLDCQWLQRLHSYGLLTPSFRPADQVVVLRSYLRQRQMLITYGGQHIQHMQKALEQMNVKLAEVVSDITGVFPKLVWCPRWKWRIPRIGLGRRRVVEEGAEIHRSALLRIRETDYRPRNLTPAFVERVRALAVVPETLAYDACETRPLCVPQDGAPTPGDAP